jgi:16S rRNA (uracil1498-N3)-methyltransferase
MNLFYDPSINLETEIFIFSSSESKHIYKVLRKSPGDNIEVTNGKGMQWRGKLTQVGNKNTKAKKIESYSSNDLRYNIEVAIAPTKNNDRMEWFIEKVTEIGIKKINFIKTENSERKKINLDRFKKIAISAMKQSKQFYLPEISNIVSLKEFLVQNRNHQKYIAHCEKVKKKHIANISLDNKPIIILIGPEGDFSKKEINDAILKKFTPISLGHQRFRTETAALFAVQTFSTLSHLKTTSLL